jgi:hypothetical protein
LALAAAPVELRLTLEIESVPAKVPTLSANSVPLKLNVLPYVLPWSLALIVIERFASVRFGVGDCVLLLLPAKPAPGL